MFLKFFRTNGVSPLFEICQRDKFLFTNLSSLERNATKYAIGEELRENFVP